MAEGAATAPRVTLRLGSALMLVGPTPDAAVNARARAERDGRAERWLATATGRADIAIVRRDSHRPALAPPLHELGVSMATAGPLLAVGFATDRDVGCDIEWEPGDLDAIGFARDHFSAGEHAAIAHLDESAGRALALRLWVAKEAILKLTGRGVFDGLDQPDLTHQIDQLKCDGERIVTTVGSGVPRVELAVTCLPGAEPATPLARIYCALACSAGP